MYAELVYPVVADTMFMSDVNRASLLGFSKCLLPIARRTDPQIAMIYWAYLIVQDGILIFILINQFSYFLFIL